MASSIINIEINPEQYEAVKKQLIELYELADRASLKIEVATKDRVHWSAYLVIALGIFALGMIFGFWLSAI